MAHPPKYDKKKFLLQALAEMEAANFCGNVSVVV